MMALAFGPKAAAAANSAAGKGRVGRRCWSWSGAGGAGGATLRLGGGESLRNNSGGMS